ncbi:Si-specific NAD(P)(+) transhydrogenase [bacterium]|nr:Si-specific NAD(P)(+) transhydrogenase [bacterium]
MDDFDLSAFRRAGRQFDLLIVGSGPAGQKAAFTAAMEGARVAIVERDPLAGGVCLNTGTIPSKTLREAVLYLTGYRQRGYYGEKYHLKDHVSSGDLLARTAHVIKLERQEINHQLEQLGVQRFVGRARVAGPHEVDVEIGPGYESRITAENILLCVGTRPRRPADIPFDDQNIFDSDAVFGRENELRPLPDSIIVMGAGVIGIEYASMFAALDIPTILVDPRPSPLSFVDDCVAELLYEHLRQNGVELIFDDVYTKVVLGEGDGVAKRVRVTLKSGREIEADSLLFALGRTPATDNIGLAEAGVALDKRGHITVDERYRSSVPSILAAGDVIGFPSLASTSAEQGRIAASTAIGRPVTWNPDTIPYGIYTIPEISMVGKTEQQCREDDTPYFVGTALWRDTARGKILGDLTGALKLIFHGETQRLVGIHIIGEGATEMVHIGQAVMHFGGGPEYFTNVVFNYPTLAEAYKLAAQNAILRREGKSTETAPLPEQMRKAAGNREFIEWR